MRKALVTGGAGFIGSHLTRALLERGADVTVLDDFSMGSRENVPPQARLVVGDVGSPETVAEALEGVDIVFHQAARVSIRASVAEFYGDAQTNFMGTLNLLKQCAGSSVKRLIFASSMAVYADSPTPRPISESYLTEPLSPYGIGKLAAEKYCLQLAREMGMDCHVLRYFNTYGPGQTYTPYVGVITIFIERLLRGEAPIIFGDGEQRRDFIHVSDIVAANLLAMQSNEPRGLYNVGTGRATSVTEIARLLCQRIAPGLSPVYAPGRPEELRNSIADISRAAGLLGFKPHVALAERLDEVIEHCRTRLGTDHQRKAEEFSE